MEGGRKAQVLYVPLPPGEPPPRELRLEVAPYSLGSEWKEIDAVALLRVPIDVLRADPPEAPPVVHRRYRPSEVDELRLRGDDWRIVWASGALPDGTRVRNEGAPRASDLHLSPQPSKGHSEYARFASEHQEGDEATLVGTVKRREGAETVVAGELLVLGGMRELRQRVLVQLVALLCLLSMIAIPLALVALSPS